MIHAWGEQQKASRSLKEEEMKFGVETPELFWGGLTSDPRMFLAVKPNTCALNRSLSQKKHKSHPFIFLQEQPNL